MNGPTYCKIPVILVYVLAPLHIVTVTILNNGKLIISSRINERPPFVIASTFYRCLFRCSFSVPKAASDNPV